MAVCAFQIQMATVTATGTSISDPFKMETYWEHGAFVAGSGNTGSW